jgi:hypothetical protein
MWSVLRQKRTGEIVGGRDTARVFHARRILSRSNDFSLMWRIRHHSPF